MTSLIKSAQALNVANCKVLIDRWDFFSTVFNLNNTSSTVTDSTNYWTTTNSGEQKILTALSVQQ